MIDLPSPTPEETRKWTRIGLFCVITFIAGLLHYVRMIVDLVLFCASHVRIV